MQALITSASEWYNIYGISGIDASLLYLFIESFDELKTLKRELKAWESMFERKHSRKPNKVDTQL